MHVDLDLNRILCFCLPDSSASFISSSSLSAAVQDDDDARSERSSLALSEISSQLAKIMKVRCVYDFFTKTICYPLNRVEVKVVIYRCQE